MPTENGVNYFRIAEAIASCATAPSSFACVCIAAICDVASLALDGSVSAASVAFCAAPTKAKNASWACSTFFSARSMI